jgi:hypothetical protein
MKILTFKNSNLLLTLFAFCCILQFSSCGQDDTINYRDRLIGEWELKNVGELQAFFRNKPFMLKNATMRFDNNGTIETQMLSSRDKKTWITQTGTWSMPRTGDYLTIKSDNSPFNDVLDIYFTDANERMFSIMLNELEYQFAKK